MTEPRPTGTWVPVSIEVLHDHQPPSGRFTITPPPPPNRRQRAATWARRQRCRIAWAIGGEPLIDDAIERYGDAW